MPACADCVHRRGDRCSAHQRAAAVFARPTVRLSGCVLAIVERYAEAIRPGMRVLEVGCGTWTLVRDRCREVGAQYEGIDTQTEYYGRPVAATRVENLARLSFPDDSFDLVLGNQTIEHWGEHGCATSWGVHQCFRVARPGGSVFMNFPVHFHGTTPFLTGDLDAVRALFAPYSSSVRLEDWARVPAPLPELRAHRSYWPLRDKGAYIVDLRAVKDKPLPRDVREPLAFGGKLGRTANYPFSFNVWRVLTRLGLLERDGLAGEDVL